MTTKNKKYTWEEVQQLCQLSDELISMAKELKLRPAELVKSLEMSKEPGNLSVENWIQQQHQKLSKSEPTTKAVKSNIAKFPTPKKSGKN